MAGEQRPLSVAVLTGIGDTILRYPEIIKQLDDLDQEILRGLPREYVAVHPFATVLHKSAPMPALLLNKLVEADGLPVLLLGNEPTPPGASERIIRIPNILRLHIEATFRATKFIGTLSCFNCAAQLAKVPSFVLVNPAVRDRLIYRFMEENDARIESMSGIKTISQIYDDAANWIKQCSYSLAQAL